MSAFPAADLTTRTTSPGIQSKLRGIRYTKGKNKNGNNAEQRLSLSIRGKNLFLIPLLSMRAVGREKGGVCQKV